MGTYVGCRGHISWLTSNRKLVTVTLDDGFVGKWSANYVALLNLLDRLVEDA